MKRVLAIMLILMFSMCAFADSWWLTRDEPKNENVMYVSSETGAKIHKKASADSRTYTVAWYRDEVTVLGKEGKWIKVEYKGIDKTYKGYIYSTLLSNYRPKEIDLSITYEVTAPWLYIREVASFNVKPIYTLHPGDSVTVHYYRGDFAYITANVDGDIYEGYVEKHGFGDTDNNDGSSTDDFINNGYE